MYILFVYTLYMNVSIYSVYIYTYVCDTYGLVQRGLPSGFRDTSSIQAVSPGSSLGPWL